MLKEILLFLKGRSSEYPWGHVDNTLLSYEDDNYSYTKVHKDVGII